MEKCLLIVYTLDSVIKVQNRDAEHNPDSDHLYRSMIMYSLLSPTWKYERTARLMLQLSKIDFNSYDSSKLLYYTRKNFTGSDIV